MTGMVSLSPVASVVLHATFIISFVVIARLSSIFGAARKKKPLYRLYYVASGLMGVSMVLSLLGLEIGYLDYAAMALDLIGLIMGCAVTYFYWDWLPRELSRG